MENGWSIKKMHRLIMLSKTYQMSAEFDEDKKLKDPENRLLSRFPRQRLSIEEIRDAFLAIGGDLDLTMGGTLDPGVGTDGETSASRISMNPESTNRRSIYLPLRRSNLPTLYMLFDFGDATSPEGKRNSHHRRHAGAVRHEQPAWWIARRSLWRSACWREAEDRMRAASRSSTCAVLDRRPDAGEIDAGLTYIQSLRKKWNDDRRGKGVDRVSATP